MATLNLLTTVTGSGVFDHPIAPGSKYGLAVATDTPVPGKTISISLSSTTNANLIAVLKNEEVKTHINSLFTIPSGYVASEYTLTIVEATDFQFTDYMREYNASVSVDVTKVNLYVTYNITVLNADEDTSDDYTTVVLFVLEDKASP